MLEDVSRRKALSLIGIALGFALALTDAKAQTAGGVGGPARRGHRLAVRAGRHQ
jgi:hypothetical protein